MDKANRNQLLIVGFFIIANLVMVLSFRPYVGVDESWQYQAGVRLSQGKGLTASLYDQFDCENNILAPANTYEYLTSWPPAYSLLVAVFAKLSNSRIYALPFINFMFKVIGLLFWLAYIRRCVDNYRGQNAIIIVLGFLALRWSGTTMFVWALFPAFLISLDSLQERIDGSSSFELIARVIAMAAVVFVLVLIRWQMLYLIAAIPVIFILRKGNLRLIISSLMVSSVVLVSYHTTKIYLEGLNGYTSSFINSNASLSGIYASLSNISLWGTIKQTLFLVPSLYMGFNALKFGPYIAIAMTFIAWIVSIRILARRVIGGRNREIAYVVLFCSNYAVLLFFGFHFDAILEMRYWRQLIPLLYVLLAAREAVSSSITAVCLNRHCKIAALLIVICATIFVSGFHIVSAREKSDDFYSLYYEIEDAVSAAQSFTDPHNDIVIAYQSDDINTFGRVLRQMNSYPIVAFSAISGKNVHSNHNVVLVLLSNKRLPTDKLPKNAHMPFDVYSTEKVHASVVKLEQRVD